MVMKVSHDGSTAFRNFVNLVTVDIFHVVSPCKQHTLNGVGLARIGYTIGEYKAVLAVNEVLHNTQDRVIKEVLLCGVLIEYLGEGEVMSLFAAAMLAVLVSV